MQAWKIWLLGVSLLFSACTPYFYDVRTTPKDRNSSDEYTLLASESDRIYIHVEREVIGVKDVEFDRSSGNLSGTGDVVDGKDIQLYYLGLRKGNMVRKKIKTYDPKLDQLHIHTDKLIKDREGKVHVAFEDIDRINVMDEKGGVRTAAIIGRTILGGIVGLAVLTILVALTF